MRHTRAIPLLVAAAAALLLSACGSSPQAARTASPSSPMTITSQRPQPPVPPASRAFTVAPPAPPLPAPPAPRPDAAPSSQPRDTVRRLITRNAEWHAPAFLAEGQTDNIALGIGDAQRLRDLIDATVPTDVARAPLPVNVTVGTIVRAKLSVISSDATVTPLDTIDKSIGEDVSILFSCRCSRTCRATSNCRP